MKLSRLFSVALFAIFFSYTSAFSQELKMVVESSLKVDNNDMDARIYYPVNDQNNKVCALIKVTVLGKLDNPLILDVGGLGVVKREEQESGEIWFYVPYQVKNLSFKCAGYTPLALISAQLKEATVYKITLRPNAKVNSVIVSELSTNYAKLVINAEGATVSLGATADYELLSETVEGSVFSKKLNYGKYYYKVEHYLFETYKGEFTLDSKTSNFNVKLKPAYGYLTVKSNPEGATVYVKGVNVGVTPCVIQEKLPKGKIPLRLQLNNYSPYIDSVYISGNGGRQEVNYVMESKLSRVTCTCDDPDAEIWIDEELKGKGSWTGYVDNVADHILESRKAGHKSQSISFSVKPGEISNQTIPAPVPMYGTLDVVTTPELCEVFVDGKSIGTSPLLAQVLAGPHTIQLKKEGFTTISFSAEVEYDNVKKVTKTLFDESTCSTPEEMYALGDNYFFGKDGVEKDGEKAVQWYQKSADMNFSPAQYALGFCYENGIGVERDMERAVALYEVSATQGNPEAQFCLGYCFEKGLGTVKDQSQAFVWYKKAAEQGHMTAQNNLAFCYKYGRGTTKDPEEAFKWYKKSAQQGFPIAQTNLGICYIDGIGVTPNKNEGIKWLRKAAQQGETNAQKKLNALGVK